MRALWILFCIIALAGAAAVWMLVVGFAGGVVFLPDPSLLSSGEWGTWLSIILLMYGPIAFAVWCAVKAARTQNDNA